MITDSQCSAPGAGRPASAVAGRAVQLRMQIRNDEALMEFYRRWADEMQVGDLAPEGLPQRIAAVAERLVARRDELAQLLSPAAPASNATLAGALVTTAAQPGISS